LTVINKVIWQPGNKWSPIRKKNVLDLKTITLKRPFFGKKLVEEGCV